jgi:type VII secretion integral membrane protein EccD
MPATSTGLTRLTVASARRRIDVALPDGVPLAELLPELLQRAGDGLADSGEEHGGWVLRRVDGTGLVATESLAAAGVRDGEILHLVPAREQWPEMEYDDVVEAIAAGARGLGAPWSGDATRIAAVVAAGFAVALATLSPAVGDLGSRALVIAAGLLIAGVLAARAYEEPLLGVALSAYALPLAAVGGPHLLDAGDVDAARLLVAGAALALWSVAAAVAVGHGLWIFVAGATAGLLGSAAAFAGAGTGAAPAAALLLVAVVVGSTGAPLLAVRLGRLPLPVVSLPAAVTPPAGAADAAALAPRPPSRLLAAVARSDEMLTGMLAGFGLAAVGAGWVLRDAGVSGLVLIGVAGVAMLLRARAFVTVRQRVPLLASGVAVLAVPLASGWRTGEVGSLVLGGVAVVTAAAGGYFRRHAPSPYLGRAADIVDTLCLVSVIPVAAAVLGLYGRMRGLVG